MSTLKTDAIQAATGTNTDLTLAGKGTGVPDLAAGFKVGSVAGVPTASIQANAVTTAKINDDAVTTAKIVNDAVTLAKLAAGTDGELITWDASGDPAAVAVGTATHILTSNGAGAAPTFQAAAGGGGGAWTLIGTGVASTSSTLTVTGIDSSTYDTHAFVFTNFLPVTSGQSLYMRLGTSGGIITTGYSYHCSELTPGSGSYAGRQGENEGYARVGIEIANSSSVGGAGGTIFLTNNDGTNYPAWYGVQTSSKVTYVSGGSAIGILSSASDIDRVQLYFASGNITSGRLTVYGVSHA